MVQGGASLSTGDMRRNGVLDAQAIYDLTYGGRGKMPGYGKDCAPRVRQLYPTQNSTVHSRSNTWLSVGAHQKGL